MTPNEAIRHERETGHRFRRKKGNQWVNEENWSHSRLAMEWRPKLGLDALDNRRFEGSLGTMQVRVSSWMRGVQLAWETKEDGEGEDWKMEDDYRVEEYAPLDEWTQGWGDTWALSSVGSGCDALNGVGGEECGPDQEFMKKMARLKQPNSRLKARWLEFMQLTTIEKVDKIRTLVKEIHGQQYI